MYILYLRHEDAICTYSCVHGSTYHTTVAGEWINSLIFDNIKCIVIVNG